MPKNASVCLVTFRLCMLLVFLMIVKFICYGTGYSMWFPRESQIHKQSQCPLPTPPENKEILAPPGMDFDAPCDINSVISSLYDPEIPLTSSSLAQLRGCMVLLYFRTPRTGSSAVFLLIQRLAKTMNFTSVLGKPHNVNLNMHSSWVKYINKQTSDRCAVAVSIHQPAANFNNVTIKPAVMINLMRHPIDHMISFFKMAKYGDKMEEGYRNNLSAACNVSFNEYVRRHGIWRKCIQQNSGLEYMYGTQGLKGDRMAYYEESKKNVDTLYLTIGISENIPAFLFVMETLLPQFFHGALRQYTNMSGLYEMFSPDPYRDEPISTETMEYLENTLVADIKLYDYIKDRAFIAVKKVLEYRTNKDLEDSKFLRVRDDHRSDWGQNN